MRTRLLLEPHYASSSEELRRSWNDPSLSSVGADARRTNWRNCSTSVKCRSVSTFAVERIRPALTAPGTAIFLPACFFALFRFWFSSLLSTSDPWEIEVFGGLAHRFGQ